MTFSNTEIDNLIVELKGSYYEMGKILGVLYKQVNFDTSSLPKLNSEQIKMADDAEELVEKYLPGMLDFLRGMSEAGFNYDDLRLLPLALAYPSEIFPWK